MLPILVHAENTEQHIRETELATPSEDADLAVDVVCLPIVEGVLAEEVPPDSPRPA